VLERHGEDVAVLIPLEDLAALEEFEDAMLAAKAERLLADPDNQEDLPWADLKAELGL